MTEENDQETLKRLAAENEELRREVAELRRLQSDVFARTFIPGCMREIHRILRAAEPPEKTVTLILEQAAVRLGAARAALFIVAQDGKSARCVNRWPGAADGLDDDYFSSYLFSTLPGLAEGLQSHEVVVFDRETLSSEARAVFESAPKFEDVFTVADCGLFERNRLIGFIAFDFLGRSKRFRPEELGLIQAIASQLSLYDPHDRYVESLFHFQRHFETLDAVRRLAKFEKERAEMARCLNGTLEVLVAGGDLAESLEKVMSLWCQALGAQWSYMGRFDRGLYLPVRSYAVPGEKLLFESGVPVERLKDFNDADQYHGGNDFLAIEDFPSISAFPDFVRISANPDAMRSASSCYSHVIRFRGEFWGTVMLYFRERHAMTEHERRFFRAAANAIQVVMERNAANEELAQNTTHARFRAGLIQLMMARLSVEKLFLTLGEGAIKNYGAEVTGYRSEAKFERYGAFEARCAGCPKYAVCPFFAIENFDFSQSEVCSLPNGRAALGDLLPPACGVKSALIGRLQFDAQARGVFVILHFEEERLFSTEDIRTMDVVARMAEMSLAVDHLEKRRSAVESRHLLTLETLARGFLVVSYVDFKNDLHYPCTSTDSTFQRYEGVTSIRETIRLFYSEHVAPCDRARCADVTPEKVVASLQRTGRFELEVCLLTDKGERQVEVRYQRVSEDGTQAVLYILDVTERRRAEAEARRAIEQERDRALAAEQAKSLFFSSVSHDIRTPLNAIVGFSELLELGLADERERERYIESIHASGKMLARLVNDVLDLSKLESGKLGLLKEAVLLPALVREVAASFEIARQQKGLSLDVEVGEMPPLLLDPQRIRQILYNLLGNAVKYTAAGGITVRCAWKDGRLELAVIDTGKGIAPEDISRVLQPFVQVADRNHRDGTGLGLPICCRLAQLMGGELTVRSEVGKGSCFRVDIPVAAARAPSEASAAAEAPTAGGGKRVLAVDDSSVNLAVLKAMLKRNGVVDVVTAPNGRVALDILRADARFDVVITDLWMPEMDGEDLVKAIRGTPELADLPVYLVTADVEAKSPHKDLGFTGILLKPITQSAVRALFT